LDEGWRVWLLYLYHISNKLGKTPQSVLLMLKLNAKLREIFYSGGPTEIEHFTGRSKKTLDCIIAYSFCSPVGFIEEQWF